MSNKNEILIRIVLAVCAFILGICSAGIGLGLAIEFNIREALTVNTKPLPSREHPILE